MKGKNISCGYKSLAVLAVVCLLFAAMLCTVLVACNSGDGGSGYTITFVLNNGEPNVVWHDGDALPNPAHGSDVLVGWYYDNGTFNNYADLDELLEIGLSKDITLYARWDADPDEGEANPID